MIDSIPYVNSIFEQPWWLEAVAPGRWGESIVKEGSEIIARLPYVIRGRKIAMPKLTQTLGPWINEKYRVYAPGNTQLHLQKEIIGELIGNLPKHISFHITLDSSNDYILPYRWLGYRYTPSFSYRICDLHDLNEVYNNFNKTAKKNIRRAEKTLRVSNQLDVDILYKQMQKTFEAQGRKYPDSKSFVTTIVNQSANRNAGKMFIATDQQNGIHACSFMIFDSNRAYALMGGSDPQFRTSGAKSLVWWSEIQAAANTSAQFDFEGSNIEGIENFVRQFGGERVTNYDIIKQSLLADCFEMAKPRIKRLIGYKI